MRRPRSRARKIGDHSCRLFRKAITAELVLRGKAMPIEEHKAALAVYHAFLNASGHKLWERFSPLHPRATGEMQVLQAELLARIDGSPEAKAWHAYARRYWKQCAEEQAEDRKREIRPARKAADMPRSELRWAKSSGGW